MAMSIAKIKKIAEALLTKKNTHVDYKNFSSELRRTTRFKNVWFQIIDKNGNSFYRSWTDKTTDSLKF